MDILNKEWNYKVNHILYIEYGLPGDLADESHYDLLSISHGKFFRTKVDKSEDEINYNCEEIENLSQLVEDYDFLKYNYINCRFIDRYYAEEDVQPYHKMHFSLKSHDGSYGLILFKYEMSEVSRYDIPDILYDSLTNERIIVKQTYTGQPTEQEEYLRFCNGKVREWENDEL